MVADDVVQWLQEQLQENLTGDESMGEIEKLVDQSTREIRRQLLERLTQQVADAVESGCPDCGRMLNIISHRRFRSVESSVGRVRFMRSYGWCTGCDTQKALAKPKNGSAPICDGSNAERTEPWT